MAPVVLTDVLKGLDNSVGTDLALEFSNNTLKVK